MSTIKLSGFSGIDNRNLLSDKPECASDMSNFRITDDFSLEKRPSRIPIYLSDETIEGIYSGIIKKREFLLTASGGNLHSVNFSNGTSVTLGYIGEGKCTMFEFMGEVYTLTSSGIKKFDGEALRDIVPYIPTLATGCAADGSGTPFEQINILTPYVKQLFSCDGTSTEYRLSERNISLIQYVEIDGTETASYTLNTEKHSITFETAPAEGINNLEICYILSDFDAAKILGCTHAVTFGGNSDCRVFLWGNENYPNYRFFSELADGLPCASYFPVTNYTVIGNSKITCITQQYNRQIIFTEKEAYYSYCELKQDETGKVYSSFPVFNLNGKKGCIADMDGCVFENRPVTLCDDGINIWESTSVENERNAVPVSDAIFDDIKEYENPEILKNVGLFVFPYTGELFFLMGDFAFVFNPRNRCWYKYRDFSANMHACMKDKIFFVSDTLIYVWEEGKNDYEIAESRWESNLFAPKGAFGCSDITKVCLDVYIRGPLEIEFYGKDENGHESEKTVFSYPYSDESKNERLVFRPRIKRMCPLKIVIAVWGTGNYILKRMTLETKSRERKTMNGIQ